MLTWRHPLLPPRNLVTKVIVYFVESTADCCEKLAEGVRFLSKAIYCPVGLHKLSLSPSLNFLQNTQWSSEQITGQSLVTLVTQDKGCVRYPTEGNSSNHELTTAMHHLSTSLARAIISLGFHVGFKPW